MVKRIALIGLFILGWQNVWSQIGIGTTIPDGSSELDVSSTSKGLLFPRLSQSQVDNIVNPAKGLMVYNTSKDCLQINEGTPSSPYWVCQGESVYSATVVNNCIGFEGDYRQGTELTSSNTFSVTLTNNSFNDVNIAFSTDDLVLSGVSGISVSSVNMVSATLVSGQSVIVEYVLSGTPVNQGTLTGVWTKLGLNCTKTVSLLESLSVFNLPQTVFVASTYDGIPLIDFPGVVDNASNQLTVKIPYSSASGSYSAYTGNYIINNLGTGESGDVNSFRLSYSAGTFDASGSGNIVATIEVDGDGSFNAKKQLFGNQEIIATLNVDINGTSVGQVNLAAIGGIPDRNFSDVNHKFIYLPVLANDGRIWLNNNLGANYSNTTHDEYAITQQSTSSTDYNAYGSLFQWGRYSDGHELINYTGSGSGSGVNTETFSAANSNTPGHSLFILSQVDWRIPQNDNLWQGESGINNPCPLGFRIPTEGEVSALIGAEGMSDNASAASSNLAFPVAGIRNKSTGLVEFPGYTGYIWTSTVNFDSSRSYFFLPTNSQVNLFPRSNGFSVRCIKD